MSTGKRKKINIFFIFVLLFFLCLCFASCDRKTTGTNLTESFKKIYEKPFTNNYTAIDIKQTQDGGYIILAEVAAEGKAGSYPYLLKIDNQGNFMWDTGDTDNEIFQDYTNPANLLVLKQDQQQQYYFFCNKVPGSQSNKVANVRSPIALLKLTDINNRPDEPEPVDFSYDLFNLNEVDYYDDKNRTIFPLHASITRDDFILLLAFDEPNSRILVRKMNINGERIWTDRHENHFQDICQYTHPILDKRHHFTSIVENDNTGNNFYYFQSYSRFETHQYSGICFRIAKIDTGNGRINKKGEFPARRPFIALDCDISGSGEVKFSGARIEDNIISFLVNFELVKDVGESVDDIVGHSQVELFVSKPVYIMTMDVNGRKTSFFAGSAKNNKIVLYAYDWSTRTLLNQKYFGHTNIYEASSLIETKDGGIAILGTTIVAGWWLGRICLFKISKSELEDFVQ